MLYFIIFSNLNTTAVPHSLLCSKGNKSLNFRTYLCLIFCVYPLLKRCVTETKRVVDDAYVNNVLLKHIEPVVYWYAKHAKVSPVVEFMFFFFFSSFFPFTKCETIPSIINQTRRSHDISVFQQFIKPRVLFTSHKDSTFFCNYF